MNERMCLKQFSRNSALCERYIQAVRAPAEHRLGLGKERRKGLTEDKL